MMPFRVPDAYAQLSLSGGRGARDPVPAEVHEYVAWLRRELALAKAYLKAARGPGRRRPPPAESPPAAT